MYLDYCPYCGKEIGGKAPVQRDRCYMNCEGWNKLYEKYLLSTTLLHTQQEKPMSDNSDKPEVLVISFGCSLSFPQLDQLTMYCDGDWEHLAVPVLGRNRLLRAIKQAIADMSDEHGRIMADLSVFEDALRSDDDD